MTQENKEMLQQSTAIMKTKYANAHHAYLLPPYFGAAVFFSAIHEIKKISVILNRQQIKILFNAQLTADSGFLKPHLFSYRSRVQSVSHSHLILLSLIP